MQQTFSDLKTKGLIKNERWIPTSPKVQEAMDGIFLVHERVCSVLFPAGSTQLSSANSRLYARYGQVDQGRVGRRVDISGVRDPFHRSISKAAVIHFHLATADYFMDTFSGEGEITVNGENARRIHVSKLSMSDRDPTHKYRTGITVVPHANGVTDPISGYYAGKWVPGTSLSIHRDDVEGYEMSGVLHKGSDADYAALVTFTATH